MLNLKISVEIQFNIESDVLFQHGYTGQADLIDAGVGVEGIENEVT